jgi:predicted kinase
MSTEFRIFLLSPANLSGERAALVFNPRAQFALARQLHSPAGTTLGPLYSFISGLYFRGKMTYAERFGRPPPGLPGGLVISPTEGLRFLHEPVTLERLRAWAEVPIDAANPRFTGPLVRHAVALEQAHGGNTRFVLLGSVATDKYVEPLSKVFGDHLLFPPDFVGRGDMSRGALLLRAARTGAELPYAPLEGARRHGPRAPGVAQRRVMTAANLRSGGGSREVPDPLRAAGSEPSGAEVVVLVGLPGAGKSTFFRQRFEQSHLLVSKDLLIKQRRPAHKQAELIAEALARGRSVVVDNTNASLEERAPLLALARAAGARIVGYYFDCSPRECLERNQNREGRKRVPRVAIFAIAKRLVRPMRSEGFDDLYRVRPLPGTGFEVLGLPEDLPSLRSG